MFMYTRLKWNSSFNICPFLEWLGAFEPHNQRLLFKTKMKQFGPILTKTQTITCCKGVEDVPAAILNIHLQTATDTSLYSRLLESCEQPVASRLVW